MSGRKLKRQYLRSWREARRQLSRPVGNVDSDSNDDSLPGSIAFDEINDTTCTIPEYMSDDDSPTDSPVTSVAQEPTICDTYYEPDWACINHMQDVVLSSSSDSENECEHPHLTEDITDWAKSFHIKHNALDFLLKLLIKYGFKHLPSTARTLLGTQRHITTITKSGMEYLYLGLEFMLLNQLETLHDDALTVATIELIFNVDGLPLFDSSRKTVWPILCAIMVNPVIIFPVALLYGDGKPSDLNFLDDWVAELDRLIVTGIHFKDKHFNVRFLCIVCDAQARALIKCTKYHTGYYCCERCEQKGKYFGKVIFDKVRNLVPRTDQTFRSQTQAEHHRGVSPLCNLDIDMIHSFPLDYMHLICLGVTKRLLLVWTQGKSEVRLSYQQKEQINTKIIRLKSYIPDLFSRKPRTLRDMEYWKATEYRLFLLYIGKLVLKGVLREDLYQHFLCFSVGMSILISSTLSGTYIDFAAKLLKYFVWKANWIIMA